MRAASPGSRLLAEPRGWPGSRWFTVHRSQAHRRAEWEVVSEQVGAARDGLPGVLGTSPRLRPPVDGVTQCVGLLPTSPRPGGWVPRGCQSDGMWPLTEHDRRHAPGSAQQVVGAGARPAPGAGRRARGPLRDCTEAEKPGPAPWCSGRDPRGLWTPALAAVLQRTTLRGIGGPWLRRNCHPRGDRRGRVRGPGLQAGSPRARRGRGRPRFGGRQRPGRRPRRPLPVQAASRRGRPRYSACRCLRGLSCVLLRHSLGPEPTLVPQDLTLTLDFICKDLLSKRHQILRF